jgi:hypothetical protein
MTDPKQEIFDILYQFEGGESVLDVGSGDVFKRPRPAGIALTVVDLEYSGVDWYDFQPADYDIIIANDLFPNVDQRLELFLAKYLPHCKEMRLSLTYFDAPKWYRARRTDGDEILTMLAWNEEQVRTLVYEYAPWNLRKTLVYRGTFPNGRRVLLVWLKGGLA